MSVFSLKKKKKLASFSREASRELEDQAFYFTDKDTEAHWHGIFYLDKVGTQKLAPSISPAELLFLAGQVPSPARWEAGRTPKLLKPRGRVC